MYALYIYIYIYALYIYIYIYQPVHGTEHLDFRGRDASRLLHLRGGIPRSTGAFP